MDDLPLGWWTDLQVLRAEGAQLTPEAFGVVARSPDNPGYHWGNFVLVRHPHPAARCLALFREHFPQTQHVSIGLLRAPDPRQWPGFALERNEVLLRDRPPAAPAPAGYAVRPLQPGDWEQTLPAEPDVREFERRRAITRTRLADSGHGVFIGAFDDEGRLAAHLGIVLCGRGVARYQDIATRAEHRRRGLASHLMAVAGAWAARRDANLWVLQVEPETPAQRLYKALGFDVAGFTHQAELEW